MKKRPIKIAQFGGGVFLRGFFDWILQKANDAKVYCGNAVIVRSKTLGEDPLAKRHYEYTHVARDGSHEDTTHVDSIAGSILATDKNQLLALACEEMLEVVVSNVTEAGMVYLPCVYQEDVMPTSFPARLTRFLYARHQQGLHGLLILPCELIENNGDTLKEMVLRHATDWQLDASFVTWLNAECSFRNTLVDRIVSGTDPQDDTLNTSEFFHLWCIEGQPDARLPFAFAGINLKWVQDLSFYRTLKVRILNGAHTAMIPFALLQGVKTVGEAMKSEKVRSHLEGCLAEIISSLGEAYEADATPYAKEVLARFSNPYIQHTCAAISLNSVSKFRVRVLPSVLEYHKQFGIYPKNLLYAFATLIHFYRTGTPRDEANAILKLQTLSLKELLKDVTLWGEDLTPLLPFLEDIICEETVC